MVGGGWDLMMHGQASSISFPGVLNGFQSHLRSCPMLDWDTLLGKKILLNVKALSEGPESELIR